MQVQRSKSRNDLSMQLVQRTHEDPVHPFRHLFTPFCSFPPLQFPFHKFPPPRKLLTLSWFFKSPYMPPPKGFSFKVNWFRNSRDATISSAVNSTTKSAATGAGTDD